MNLRRLFTFAALFGLAAILALLPGASKVVAQAPASGGGTISYSGRLSNDANQPVADGMYGFTFALYDAADGGNLLWSETQSGVAVKGGGFSTQLGSVAVLPDTARTNSAWLAVSVRGPDETAFTALSPRQSLDVAVASAPSSPAASAACAHDHFGESWSGSTTLYGTAFEVENKVVGGGYAIAGKGDQNGVGVIGISKSGVGVWAQSDPGGTAILIDGSIRVYNAGVDSDTPVFIHKVTTGAGGNICADQTYATVIDNPIINSKPAAILIVTPNYGPRATGVAPAVGIPAVYYDAIGTCGKGAGKWVIYNLDTTAQINNSLFNVMAVQ